MKFKSLFRSEKNGTTIFQKYSNAWQIWLVQKVVSQKVSFFVSLKWARIVSSQSNPDKFYVM